MFECSLCACPKRSPLLAKLANDAKHSYNYTSHFIHSDTRQTMPLAWMMALLCSATVPPNKQLRYKIWICRCERQAPRPDIIIVLISLLFRLRSEWRKYNLSVVRSFERVRSVCIVCMCLCALAFLALERKLYAWHEPRPLSVQA